VDILAYIGAGVVVFSGLVLLMKIAWSAGEIRTELRNTSKLARENQVSWKDHVEKTEQWRNHSAERFAQYKSEHREDHEIIMGWIRENWKIIAISQKDVDPSV
jgi:hypothetical protein